MTQQHDRDARLSAYLDGDLDDTARERLEQELEQDASLRQDLADLQLTLAALRSLPEEAPPRSFRLTPEQLGQAVAPNVVSLPVERARRRAPVTWLRTVASIAAMLFVALISLDVITTTSTTSVAPEAAPQIAAAPRSEPPQPAMASAPPSAPTEAPMISTFQAPTDSATADNSVTTESPVSGAQQSTLSDTTNTPPEAAPQAASRSAISESQRVAAEAQQATQESTPPLRVGAVAALVAAVVLAIASIVVDRRLRA